MDGINYDQEIQKHSPSYLEFVNRFFDTDREPDQEYHPEDDEDKN